MAEFIKVKNLTDYDPKTTLQEWAQSKDHPIPIYRLIEREGIAHLSTFTVSVIINGYEQTGKGHSIKEAEKTPQEVYCIDLKMIKQKTVSICIIGRPNSGKSTLLNRIIGEQLSIVTPKVQTTRSIITDIITLKDTQIILYDTPGIFEPKGTLEKAMVRCAWSSLHSADIVMLIIDVV